MKPRDGSNLNVLLAVAAVALTLAGIYAGAYLGLTTQTTRNTHSGGTCRVYRAMWLALLFLPAALIESAVTGEDTSPAWTSPNPP
jgi:hypothetical protein